MNNLLLRIGPTPNTAGKAQDRLTFLASLSKNFDRTFSLDKDNETLSLSNKLLYAYKSLKSKNLKSPKSFLFLSMFSMVFKNTTNKYLKNFFSILDNTTNFIIMDTNSYLNNFLIGYIAANKKSCTQVLSEDYKNLSLVEILENDFNLDGALLFKSKKNLDKNFYRLKSYLKINHISIKDLSNSIKSDKDLITIFINNKFDMILLGYLYRLFPNNIGYYISNNLEIKEKEIFYFGLKIPRIYSDIKNVFYTKVKYGIEEMPDEILEDI